MHEPDAPRDQLSEVCDALDNWAAARRARAIAEPGGHDWANAEMAVRFWRGEFRALRAEMRGDQLAEAVAIG